MINPTSYADDVRHQLNQHLASPLPSTVKGAEDALTFIDTSEGENFIAENESDGVGATECAVLLMMKHVSANAWSKP